MKSGATSKIARRAAAAAARKARDRLAEPWRTGRPGPAAEAGRWLGAGLAAGAILLGVGLAIVPRLRGGRGTGRR